MSDTERSMVGYTRQRTTQLSGDQDEQIELLARRRQLSVSAVIRAAVREYLASDHVRTELEDVVREPAVA